MLHLESTQKIDINNAGDGIRTRERLRDRALNPAPLTWLGNPRSEILFDRLRADPDLTSTLPIWRLDPLPSFGSLAQPVPPDL